MNDKISSHQEDELIDRLLSSISSYPINPYNEYLQLTALNPNKVIPRLVQLYKSWEQLTQGSGLDIEFNTPALLNSSQKYKIDYGSLEGQQRFCLEPLLSALAQLIIRMNESIIY